MNIALMSQVVPGGKTTKEARDHIIDQTKLISDLSAV